MFPVLLPLPKCGRLKYPPLYEAMKLQEALAQSGARCFYEMLK